MSSADSEGIALVFSVAGEEASQRCFAGLTLLSQVCADEMLPGVCALPITAMLAPRRRVGLRDPTNDERRLITLLPPLLPKASGHTPRSVYRYFCKEYSVKANSTICAMLSDIEDDFSSVEEINAAGNFIGDRGVLPLVELARYCPRLRRLRLPSNGLKNSAVEVIVHMLLDTSGVSGVCAPAPAAAPASSPSASRVSGEGTAAAEEGVRRDTAAVVPFVPPLCATTLEEIDLSGNRLTIGAGKLLVDLARSRTNILRIDLRETKVDDFIVRQLESTLQNNAMVPRAAEENQ